MNEERIGLYDDLKFFGYLLPTNDYELEEFEKVYGSTQTILPDKFKDLNFLDSYKKETKKGSDYFKKMVLAAEIVNQLHTEFTFGHIKFVKILYLSEQVCQMKLSTSYRKFAAGPLDPKYLYSIDSFLKSKKWFAKVKRDDFGFKYVALENRGEHISYFNNYFHLEKESLMRLLNLFKKEKTDFCEIVATMYYVWDECLKTNVIINNNTLIQKFYEWGDRKKKFKNDQLINSINWMLSKGIYPNK